MPPIDTHAPGTFCWVELATTDQDAAKQFYGSLFGWSATDIPMGAGEFYTMFQLDGKTTAAAYKMGAREQGAPAHWNLYVCVADAEASLARAVELGAKALSPVFDVYTNGRMAVILDPEGAAFCLWQPKQTQGIGVMGEPNTYVWADLTAGDRMAAKRFYQELFGWEIIPGTGKDDSSYLHILAAEKGIGGILPATMRQPGVAPHWMPYFMVTSADASTTKAQQLGAKVYAPPMNVGESLRIAVMADPQGATFALFQS